MQQVFVDLTCVLVRSVDLVIAASEEDERADCGARQVTECQYAANEDEMVATIVQGIALALEMGQCTGHERDAGRAQNRLKARPFVVSRLGKACRQSVPWISLRTLIPHLPAACHAGQHFTERARENNTSGGSSETELNELMVVP